MSENSNEVRVAIVGVGNCASSLVQGVQYYQDADENATVPGLMHVKLGKYHVRDVKFVAAFDVDAKKVGFDLSEAIFASREQHHQDRRRAARPTSPCSAARPSTASASTTPRPSSVSDAEPVDVVKALKDAKVDVLVSYLPVGSEEADKFYAQCAIDAGVAFVNALPVFIASDPVWAKKFERRRRADRRRRHQEPGRRHHHPPRDGQAVRGPRRAARPHHAAQRRRQHGLPQHARARAPRVQEDLQDPGRHVATCSASSTTKDVHIGPSDHVGWLDDRKWAYVRLEGRAFGDVPLNLEYKLEVWDSPNSAGVIIDAVRAAKIALDRGIGGPVDAASAYLMKSPPKQLADDIARDAARNVHRGLDVLQAVGQSGDGWDLPIASVAGGDCRCGPRGQAERRASSLG